MLALVTLVTRPFIYLELRNQRHTGLNGDDQVDPANMASDNIPLRRLTPAIRRNHNASFDGPNDTPPGAAEHHDFTLLDLRSVTWERVKAKGRAAGEKLGASWSVLQRWVAASSKPYYQDPIQTIQIVISVVALGINIFLVGFFASKCAYWTEQLAADKHINVYLLGSFIFPATELLAFLPILRESFNGEFPAALVHSYRSAGLTFSLAPAIAMIAAKTKGEPYYIDLDTLLVVTVLGATLISVLTTAFINQNSRLGHFLAGTLLLVLMVIGPLLAWLLDTSAATNEQVLWM